MYAETSKKIPRIVTRHDKKNTFQSALFKNTWQVEV